MPRPHPPPTPGSSTELGANDGGLAAPTFHLPPTAFPDYDRKGNNSSTPSANGSDSSYRPVSPRSPEEMSRKRPVAGQTELHITRDDFALPPPPTRSHKIIQVKPKRDEQQANRSSSNNAPATITATSPARSVNAGKSSSTGSKRKQNSASTTAAGRKIARKTAHSLIERRRRSKMNEEFGVLKDMIPACHGQEMHKLAILQVNSARRSFFLHYTSDLLAQASIDYLRYLQQCVADLQAQNNSPRATTLSRPPARHENDDDDEIDEDEDEDVYAAAVDEGDEDEDEEMEDDAEDAEQSTTPAMRPYEHPGSMVFLPPLSQITNPSTTSPSILSTRNGRHHSHSSASQAGFSPYFLSNQTSPAFGPQLPHHMSAVNHALGLGSPALKPTDSASALRSIAEGASELSDQQRYVHSSPARGERDPDHEATAALLMLNHDRRNRSTHQESESGRSNAGMSVRDLLSG